MSEGFVQDVTMEDLQVYLAWAERDLEETEHKIEALQNPKESNDQDTESVLYKLSNVEQLAAELGLAKDISDWIKSASVSYDNNNSSSSSINNEIMCCESLAKILCHHATTSALFQNCLQDEYLPLYSYVEGNLLIRLHQSLQASGYPNKEGCEKLILQADTSSHGEFEEIATCCSDLTRLQRVHRDVVKHAGMDVSDVADMEDIVMELCQPFVDRLKYHFLDETNNRPTYVRVDRLPEWLFEYVKENILEGGPWDFVSQYLAPNVSEDLPSRFLNELVRMVQWVFGERDFFRHPTIAGPSSRAMVLCAAVEEILGFDSELKSRIPATHQRRVLSAFDIFVAGDEELLSWWLEREKESIMSEITSNHDLSIQLPGKVSPYSELFCALIKSIKVKASLFTFSGPYINYVASPLCAQFIENIQNHAKDLRKELTARSLISDAKLEQNITAWIEMINGARLSTDILLEDDLDSDVAAVLQDLVHFGTALERLTNALVDDFAMSFVDTVLMERAKLAGYVMRCSHMLSVHDHHGQDDSHEVSPDLKETQRLLYFFLAIVDALMATYNARAQTSMIRSEMDATKKLHDAVLARISNSLLEVVLDVHETTPRLAQSGGKVFYNDISILLRSYMLPNESLRLLDIARLVATSAEELSVLGEAMYEMAGVRGRVSVEDFTADDKVYNEAMSMLHAKGFVWTELADFLSIYHRRL
jgi:hypothetical protein